MKRRGFFGALLAAPAAAVAIAKDAEAETFVVEKKAVGEPMARADDPALMVTMCDWHRRFDFADPNWKRNED